MNHENYCELHSNQFISEESIEKGGKRGYKKYYTLHQTQSQPKTAKLNRKRATRIITQHSLFGQQVC